MQVVKHKVFGVGEVIEKNETANGSYITVRFIDSEQKTFAIPLSFAKGILTVEGDLKDEVDASLAKMKVREQERLQEARVGMVTSVNHTARITKGSHSVPTVYGAVATAYEAYLIEKDYSTQTPAGNPSTVYSYIGAIERHVLDSEHITWDYLKDNIDAVVKKYDVGGAKEAIGAKSNSTVINALKRFKNFVNP